MQRYQDNYQLFGIRPWDSWQKLRNAYKSQMRRWHPDRFDQNDPTRHQAEERTKEINRLYQELADFYHQNGKLPLDAAPKPPTITRIPVQADSVPASSSAPQTDGSPPTSQNEYSKKGLRPGLIFSLVAVFVASYALWDTDIFMSRHETIPTPTDSQVIPITGVGTAEETSSTNAQQFFDIGSTLGEVYSIQGVPNLVEGDIWHYGKARVHFHNGRVTQWIDTEDHLLKLRAIGAQPAPAQKATTFGYGSTRDEVRALQGSPLRELENVWDYELSRVYFDKTGRVTNWQESPMNPLHVKH